MAGVSRSVMVINAKGGCGKTTIATNLSAYYASRGYATVLIDHDPQYSSSQWLSARPGDVNPIHGISTCKYAGNTVTQSFVMRMPANTQRVVLDTPASLARMQLPELVRRVDAMIIPVLPSPIDMRALMVFIRDLFMLYEIRRYQTKVTVVANRVRENTRSFQSLCNFLDKVRMPVISRFRDSQNYIRAAEQGLGIHEMKCARLQADQDQWAPLLKWLDSEEAPDYDVNAVLSCKEELF
jgi:chromosome partitioning protein